VFKFAGFQAAAVAMNIVILTSPASCTNSVVYVASRMLMALSQEGKAPKVFGKVNSKGIPTPAILMTMAIGLVSLATNFASPDKVFVWIVSIAGFNTLLTWFGILLSHYRFRKWLVNNGGKVENLKFKSKAYPTATILGLLFLIFIAIVTAVSPSTRLTFYIGAPMIVIYFAAGYIVYKQGRIIPVDYKASLEANINNASLVKDDTKSA
jgi:amino acid permease